MNSSDRRRGVPYAWAVVVGLAVLVFPALVLAQNQAPSVDAGVDQGIAPVSVTATLDATVTDDGLPDPPASVTVTWTKQSGPGTVTFGNANAVDTTAEFETHGTYVLRLTAEDDDLTDYDDVTIGVSPRIDLPAKVEVENYRYGGEGVGFHEYGGGVEVDECDDEGGGYCVTSISVDEWLAFDVNVPVSGDYDFTFRYHSCGTETMHVLMDESNVTGTVTVTYTPTWANKVVEDVSLTAGDHVMKVYFMEWWNSEDELNWVEITHDNEAPTVDAGSNQDVNLPSSASLDGTVNDDGWPDYPGNLTTTWSKDSGPGTVTFGDASAVDTTAAFSVSGVYVLKLTADDTDQQTYDTCTVSVNSAPTVEAGNNETITWPTDQVNLDGTVNDDGYPDPPGSVSTTWTRQSGPGTVTFTNAAAVDTTATFSASGSYVLRLTADDDGTTAYDEVTITVNSVPSVNAGSDDEITLPNNASLDGDVSDDGLPDPPGTLTTTWTKQSGPGTVTFGNASAVDTTAAFSVSGVYVLRLTADDDDAQTYDDVQITVNASNTAPTVDAGVDQGIAPLSATATLDATVTDDGLPDPPAAYTVTWTKQSGPGTVTFGDTSAVDTTAQFETYGTYVLRLTADDDALTDYDEVTIGVSPRIDLPAKIEAEDYRYGDEGVGFHDISSAPGLIACGDTGGGYAVKNVAVDEWLAYDVYVPQTGDYTFTFRHLNYSSKPVHVMMDDTNVTGTVYLPYTDSTYGSEVVEDVSLTAGNHVMKVCFDAWWNSLAELNYIEITHDNAAPTVDAGSNQDVNLPNNASLDGTVNDDGWPDYPGNLTTTWTKDSGPGTVTFGDASAVDTTAAFSVSGVYVLRLTADDGDLTDYDTCTVSANSAPTVEAGNNETITWPTDQVNLDGTVNDDGYPDPPGTLTTTWTKQSGPGTVTFDNANAVDTTATFSTSGTYVLRLTADDGALTDYDEVTITVNAAPTVDAGSNQTITWPTDQVNLDGTVNDDGLPDPPSSLTTTWTKQSGPGTVTFTNAAAVDTTATFSASGSYVLRLTADDDDTTTYDEVTITVNASPTVDAGSDDEITLPNNASLDGDVSDDGLPDPPGTLTTTWTKQSGPGTVTFGNASAVDTTAAFSVSGVYVLRLTAADDDAQTYDDVQITVNGSNAAPTVDAGVDHGIAPVSAIATLDATVSDDGSPDPPGSVTTTWTKQSGPGTVTFGNATAVDTTAEFETHGTYVLRLTADDDALTDYDEVTIGVSPRITLPAKVEMEDYRYGGEGVGYDDYGGTPDIYSCDDTGGGYALGSIAVDEWVAFDVYVPTSGDYDFTFRYHTCGTETMYVMMDDTNVTGTVTVTYVQTWTNKVVEDVSLTAGNHVMKVCFDQWWNSEDRLNYINITSDNVAPTVDAGLDQDVDLPNDATLDATVTDDGLPDPPGSVTTTWTKDSGPGTVTFGNASAVDTTAAFSVSGVYVLKLTADDGSEQVYDTCTVSVNSAPTVDAGADDEITLPNNATLDATVTDDGYPDPPGAYTVVWSKQSGPGTVTFADYDAVDTTAAFSAGGTYVLRLTANDGSADAYDTCTITVNAQNTAPTVAVGPDLYVEIIDDATLDATVTDDGLPNPPGSVTTTWTKQSGPGTVTFGNTAAVDTTAEFETYGTYVLRLTGDDDDLTAYDELTVAIVPEDALILPCKIEAEDYRAGGEGVGYGGTVTVAACDDEGGGYAVKNVAVDEWLAYDVYVPETANYTFTFRHENCSGEPIHVMMDDSNVTGTVTLPYAASWSSKVVEDVELTAGNHVMKVWFEEWWNSVDMLNWVEVSYSQSPDVDAGADQAILLTDTASLDGDALGEPSVTWSKYSGPGTVTFGNANALTTTATFSAEGTYVLRLTAEGLGYDAIGIGVTSPVSVPATIQAEDYMYGSNGAAYYDTTEGGGDPYRTGDDVDIYSCSDTGGGYCIGLPAIGEWQSYGISVSSAGWYKFTLRACSELDWNRVGFLLEGEELTDELIFPATYSGTEAYDDIIRDGVYLPSGDRVLTLVWNKGGGTFKINWLKIETSQAGPSVDAGVDQQIALSTVPALDATVTDNGLPDPPDAFTTRWTVDSRPFGGYAYFNDSYAADTTVTFDTPGTYVLRLTADDSVAQGYDTCTITVSEATDRATLPGRLEAEDYSDQGEGISYHDTTSGNAGSTYRSDDVDIESCGDTGGGYNVSWIVADEWLAFDVDVSADTRCYDVVARVSSTTSSREMHVEVDGVDVTGAMTFGSTGGWTNVTAEGIHLTAGRHTIKVVMDTGDFKLNYVDFLAESYEEYIVENGVANADIVISSDPERSVTWAASELQDIVEQITGAELPIVTTETGADVHIYVGQSSYTDSLGISTSGLKYDAFKMVSGSDWLALIGPDDDYEPIDPRSESEEDLEDWDEITGSTYRVPVISSGMSYNYSMDLWLCDGKGSLQAVYEFCRDLGCRWYYPGSIGECVPDMDDIGLPVVNRTVEPDYALRKMFMIYHRFLQADEDEAKWQLRLGINEGHDSWGWVGGHGIGWVIGREEMKEAHPEYYALINGERDTQGWKGDGNPCLSSEGLFDENVNFIKKVYDHYEQPCVSISPPDGFTMCQCNDCDGQERQELGMNGYMSDYVYDYVNEVAEEVYLTHPSKKICTSAYATFLLPPVDLDEFSPNVIAGMARWTSWLIDDEYYQDYTNIVDDWFDVLASDEIFLFDYYLHPANSYYKGTPVYFMGLLKNELRTYNGRCMGQFTEISRCLESQGLPWEAIATNHLNIHTTARLFWDAELDLAAMLDEYYDKFYGPASDEMKTFVEYCEANWETAPSSETILGQMRTYLNAAITAANGQGVYEDRVDLVDEFLKVAEE